MEKATLEERANCSPSYMNKQLEHPWLEALQKGLLRGDGLEETTCPSL